MNASDVQITGRMWGYTDEIDWVERSVRKTVDLANAKLVERDGPSAAQMEFTVTDRKVTGSRGFFTKRLVSKYEYEIAAPSRGAAKTIANLVNDLVGRIS